MEEDEVILEGSSLHQYLKEMGFTDFEVASSEHVNKNMLQNVKELENSANTGKKDHISIKNSINKVLGLANAEDLLLKSFGSRIISSRLLEEADLLLLETLSPSIESLCSNPTLVNTIIKEKPNENVRFTEYFLLSTPMLCVWGAIVVAILALNLVAEMTLVHCLCIWGALLLIFFFARYFYLNKYELCRSELEKTLFIIEKSNSVAKKCLKFLNELKMLRKCLSQKAELLNLSECHYENGLSEGVCSLLDSLSSSLKMAHWQLQTSKMCSSQNIHALFERQLGCDEITVAEDLSHLFLKTKREAIASQSSSFLTELFLCFEYSRNTSVFKVILQAKFDLLKAKIDWLERILHFYQRIWLNEEAILKSIVHPPRSYEKLKWDVVGAIDALSIRCRILAYSGTYLKEIWVEDLDGQNSQVLYENVKQTCEDIRSELSSCYACTEELVERANNYFGKKRDDKGHMSALKPFEELDRQESSSLIDETPVRLQKIEEMVLQDEVFEAVVDHDKLKNNKIDLDESWLQDYKTVKKMKKKQKERCKRVLQEIQPILQKRREMWFEREAKALERMEQNRKGAPDVSNPELNPTPDDSGVSSPVQDASALEMFPRESPSSDPIQNGGTREYLNPTKKDVVSSFQAKPALTSISGDDSEEERLLLYRKVRKELDEDEARRNEHSEGGESSTDEENWTRSSQESSLPEAKSSLLNGSFSLELCSSSYPSEAEGGVYSVAVASRDANEKLGRKSQSVALESRLSSSVGSCSLIDPLVQPLLGSCDEADRSEVENNSEFSFSPKHFNQSSKSAAKTPSISTKEQKGESLSCGETDEDDEIVIDWSSCRFSRNQEALSSGPGFFGLPSVLASVPRRDIPLTGAEEVFGGVGEGASESEDGSEE